MPNNNKSLASFKETPIYLYIPKRDLQNFAGRKFIPKKSTYFPRQIEETIYIFELPVTI